MNQHFDEKEIRQLQNVELAAQIVSNNMEDILSYDKGVDYDDLEWFVNELCDAIYARGQYEINQMGKR